MAVPWSVWDWDCRTFSRLPGSVVTWLDRNRSLLHRPRERLAGGGPPRALHQGSALRHDVEGGTAGPRDHTVPHRTSGSLRLDPTIMDPPKYNP